MTAQFPSLVCADAQPGSAVARRSLPGWPRLMRAPMAAAYLGIGVTKLTEDGPKPKHWGGARVWDIRDLDRFADAIGGDQPLDPVDGESHSREVERAWLEGRKNRGKG